MNTDVACWTTRAGVSTSSNARGYPSCLVIFIAFFSRSIIVAVCKRKCTNMICTETRASVVIHTNLRLFSCGLSKAIFVIYTNLQLLSLVKSHLCHSHQFTTLCRLSKAIIGPAIIDPRKVQNKTVHLIHRIYYLCLILFTPSSYPKKIGPATPD